MPDPEPYEPASLTGNAPSDLQAETARLVERSGSCRSSSTSTTKEARDDLARLSAQMMSIVAKSAAVHDGREPGSGRRRRPGRDGRREVPAALARRGRPGSREGDRHLLDLHGRARPERLDVHRADHRLDGRRLRRRDVRRRRGAQRAAPRRRAGTGAADARRGRRTRRPGGLRQGPPRPARARSWASATASTGPRIRARASSSGRRRSSVRRASKSPRRSRKRRSPRCTSASPTT